MAFVWAVTQQNLIRSTWNTSQVLSATSEATGYPKENVINGNRESRWSAAAGGANSVVIDSGDASLDMDYICMWFDIYNLPTSVKVETSHDNIAYASTDTNYDGTVSTTTIADVDGSSRSIGVVTAGKVQVGNTIRIQDGSYDNRYLVIGKSGSYLEIDRYPSPYGAGATVTVYPGPVILLGIQAPESRRYIRITVTGTPAHLLEVQAFKVRFLFDNTSLPLNPYPVQRQISLGGTVSSFSGYHIGKMSTGPARSQWRFGMGRIFRDALAVFDWLIRQNRFGILMDDGMWFELTLTGSIDTTRRPASDAEVCTYVAQMSVQEV